MKISVWTRLALLGGIVAAMLTGCERQFEDDLGERPNQGPKAADLREGSSR